MIEIRLNDDKTLDQVVGEGFSLEQMTATSWALCFSDKEKRVQVWLHSKATIRASYEESPPQCPHSIKGDDGTVKQCVERGHCGCDEGKP